ncbi:MAG: hypothetical protein KJT03_23150, partial [Verrucomicrobiae bacterium]|nr:hypothetical protein [Verrucomicrobiae bacterium]
YDYDAVGNLEKITLPRGSNYRILNTYDSLNRLTSTTDPEGNRTEYKYNEVGLTTEIIDPRTFKEGSNYRTTMTYDFLNRLSTRTTTLGLSGGGEATEVFVFDKVGNLKSYQDGRGSYYTTTYKYDELNRVVEVSEPSGTQATPGEPIVTGYDYDKADNVTITHDPRGTFFDVVQVWDSFNRLVEVHQPTGTASNPGPVAVSKMTYDLAGNMLTTTDPRGDFYTATYTYDFLNRMRSISQPTGTPDGESETAISFYDYDAASNLEKYTDPGGHNTLYTYDKLNRRETEEDNRGNLTTYKYDEHGNVIKATFAAGEGSLERVVTTTYDKADRPIKITNAEGYVTTNTYDAVGNLTKVTGPFSGEDGMPFSTTYRFDGGNRVRSMTDAAGYTTEYTYDAVGNQLTMTDGRGSYYQITSAYDAQNRKIRVETPTGTE